MMPGEGNGTPLQYSCLENPMDGGAWWAAAHRVSKSRTQLCDFTFTFHFQALEKEMATHSSVLAWRIPGTGEPGGRPSMGSHSVGHNWSDLAAAAAAAAAKWCHLHARKYRALYFSLQSSAVYKSQKPDLFGNPVLVITVSNNNYLLCACLCGRQCFLSFMSYLNHYYHCHFTNEETSED